MSSENNWIPWDDRTELKTCYLYYRFELFWGGTIEEKIFRLYKKIPKEWLSEIEHDIFTLLVKHWNLFLYKNGLPIIEEGEQNVCGFKIRLLTLDNCSREERKFIIKSNTSAVEVKLKNDDKIFSSQISVSEIEEIINTVEQLDKYEHEQKQTSAPAVSDSPAVPASVPVDKESSAVLFVPEFDGSNDWIKTSEMAQEMVNNEISIDIEAAKKHLRNMKSNGKKSAEKYDGKNSTYGEINISSFQVKWRMVRNGGKWNVYFYRPSLKWEQK